MPVITLHERHRPVSLHAKMRRAAHGVPSRSQGLLASEIRLSPSHKHANHGDARVHEVRRLLLHAPSEIVTANLKGRLHPLSLHLSAAAASNGVVVAMPPPPAWTQRSLGRRRTQRDPLQSASACPWTLTCSRLQFADDPVRK